MAKKTADLFFQEGSSDKVYHIQLEEANGGFLVNFQYGRRGNALQSGSKTTARVSEAEAVKIFDKLEKEKRAKGYDDMDGEKKSEYSTVSPTAKKEVIISPQLLNDITLEDVERLINDDRYLAQEKKDGERRMVVANKGFGKAIGLNKKGTEVPLPILMIESIDENDCILDGEIIGETLHIFDLLALNGNDLTSYSCIQRIAYLNSLEFGLSNIQIVPTAFTKEEKRTLFERLKKENKEGIVFKLNDAAYKSGRPASGGNALKFKFKKSCTCIVKNITKGKCSIGLEVMDGDKKVYIGKVTVPPNKQMPNINDLVEVEYLYAFPNGGCLFQPVLKEIRFDSDLTDATIDKLVYKAVE